MKQSIITLMLVSAGIVAGCSSSRESVQRAAIQAPMTQNSQQIVAATPKVIRDIQLIAQHCNPVMGRFSHISLLF